METEVKKIIMPQFVISGKTLFESPVQDYPMLWGHYFPKIGIALLAGSSDCGKSSLMRQLSGAIVFGESKFLGLRLDTIHKSVVYVCSEDTDEDIKRIMKREHLEKRSADGYCHIHFIFDIDRTIEKIEELLKICPVDCVILDSLNDFIRGDGNNAFFVRQFMEKIRILAMKYKCLFVLIHHYRKSAPDTNASKNDVLGSQSIEAKARAVISMEKSGGCSKERILRITKGNYVHDDLKEKVLKIVPDEKFVFSSTGELLVNTTIRQVKSLVLDDNMKSIIIMFHGQGYSARKIADVLKEMGHKISKSTVSEFLRERNRNGQCPES